MTREHAQEILLAHRAGGPADAETSEALRMAATDPELAQWLEQHRDFHANVEKQFANLEPPADLKSPILAGAKVTDKKESLFRRHQVWAIAAAIIVLFALSDWLLSRNRDER